ncbi:DUF58 domain-containing protein [Halobacillus sp. A5]|uniref:DUF58 domain-containing protein n=1 Tax=Halobacillus sp. A5 TaxID=2880263 RepID=UPI0020A63F62|nr:DUF58 domain-containing protein [Halobacillus sp. A5]MCP3028390.1 DUF58 domain-containing protein [Halobacillus sp. A5]
MKQTFHFTARIITVSVLFAVLFSYAMFQGGFVSWFLFYSFLPFLIYMTALTFYRLDNWEVNRYLSKRAATAGETLQVEIKIDRRFPFPLYYCVVEEYFPQSLMNKDLHLEKYKYMDDPAQMNEFRQVKKISFPWFKRHISCRYELEKVPRGEHHLKALRVKTADFFGFIKKEYVYMLDHQFLVFPYQRKVKLTEKAYSFEQGASPSFKLNEKNTNVVSGVREYVPGDRFSWIDWKNTAKSNQMMTKEFEQEKSVDMLLVLNGVHNDKTSPLSFEGAVEFSASLLEELHKKSSQLAFMTLGDGKRYFPFQQDYQHKDKIHRHLAEIKAIGRTSFAEQLERERFQLPSGIVLLIVSHELNPQLLETITRLTQKSKRLVFFYVRPQSQLDFEDHKLIKKMSSNKIVVNVLTEEELTKREFEVNT